MWKQSILEISKYSVKIVEEYIAKNHEWSVDPLTHVLMAKRTYIVYTCTTLTYIMAPTW